ncbi:uncharacterized protein SCODWIG_00526 [Saccharomycodes ludwigii]|uniref:Protein SNA3 n=1 Tax=Saccharomycodes ludwigii TaxID=36035 RepID=A0A376B250_9ASCO|nr:uncharacterized protein SCODWIG_00526 [Saccharomycodes ludwigii]
MSFSRFSLNKNDILLILVSLVLPFYAVIVRCGFWSKDFLINILLTLMYGLPGLVHSIYIIYITSTERNTDEYLNIQDELESGNTRSDAAANTDNNKGGAIQLGGADEVPAVVNANTINNETVNHHAAPDNSFPPSYSEIVSPKEERSRLLGDNKIQKS